MAIAFIKLLKRIKTYKDALAAICMIIIVAIAITEII